MGDALKMRASNELSKKRIFCSSCGKSTLNKNGVCYRCK